MPYKLNPLTGGLDYYESGLPSQATHSGKYLTTDGSDASWAALAGGGDMAAATYDPTTVAGDAFDMDNMNDGSTNKVMTATQETNFETAYSHSQAAHGDADADNTASNETSHADVVQDGDFSSNGLMRRTGAGAYDTVTDGTTNWDTAYSHSQAAHGDADADNTASNETSHADVVVDGDFDSDGFLIRSGGAGSYSVDTSTYSASDHDHAGTYEPADATIIKQADVDDVPVNGVTTAPVSSNWAYDHADSHAPSNADNTAANETSHADVVVDADIGVNVAAYDHNHDADYADIANEHAESHTVASHSDTSATGAELDELTDGSTTSLHSHAGGGGGISEYMYCVWAEENAALGASNTYEWAFGNGANTPADGGMNICPKRLDSRGCCDEFRCWRWNSYRRIVHNGTPQGRAQELCFHLVNMLRMSWGLRFRYLTTII
jgi:hypothetical protein